MWVRSLCGRSPGEGHGNPLWYSCLKNPTDRGVWTATVHRAAKSRTRQKQVSMHALSWVTINCPTWQFNVWHILFYLPLNYLLPLNWSSLNLLNMTEHSVGLHGKTTLKTDTIKLFWTVTSFRHKMCPLYVVKVFEAGYLYHYQAMNLFCGIWHHFQLFRS